MYIYGHVGMEHKMPGICFTVKDNPIASFPSTKLYLDVGRLLFSSFFFTSPRLSSYFLYFIKMSFHHINESQKKNGSSP